MRQFDAQYLFWAFYDAVANGDCYKAAILQGQYADAAQIERAEDADGAEVVRLDNEQDRYLVIVHGCERWRRVS